MNDDSEKAMENISHWLKRILFVSDPMEINIEKFPQGVCKYHESYGKLIGIEFKMKKKFIYETIKHLSGIKVYNNFKNELRVQLTNNVSILFFV